MARLKKYTIHSDANATVELVAARLGVSLIPKRLEIQFEADLAAADNITLNRIKVAPASTTAMWNATGSLLGSVYGFDLSDVPDEECERTEVGESLSLTKPTTASNVTLWYKEV